MYLAIDMTMILFLMIMCSFLIIWFILNLYGLKRHVDNQVKRFTNENTKCYTDLKVYFKNYDIFKKKNRFNISVNSPIYNFNNCDIYLSKENILLIGKSNLLGKTHQLNITIIFKDQNHDKYPGFVRLKDLSISKTHIEIKFKDRNFDKPITAMIKNKDDNLETDIRNWLLKNDLGI